MTKRPVVRLSELGFHSNCDSDSKKGFLCRECGCRDSIVKLTDKGDNFGYRTRECRHCGNRFGTREIPMEND